MSTLTIIFPRGIRVMITPQRWFAAALWLLAALLLWAYVAVLNRGVERGNRMRAEQLRAATQPPAAKTPRVAPVETAKADAQP